VLLIAQWVIGAAHYGSLGIEQQRFGSALSNALFAAALWGLIYLAIEPQVRRLRPAMLVTWSRLVSAGSWRDPMLGRDVAIGAAAGALETLITYAQHLLPSLFGWQEFAPQLSRLDLLLGPGFVFAALFATAGFALQNSFLGAMGLILLRRVVPSMSIAFAIAIVLFSFLAASGQIQTGRLWLDVLFGGALVAVVAGVILRFGVVAGAFTFLVHFVTMQFPLTMETSRSYFGLSAAGLVGVVGLCVAGVVIARSREPLFGRAFD
jgi:serine/threonine-protein kinase